MLDGYGRLVGAEDVGNWPEKSQVLKERSPSEAAAATLYDYETKFYRVKFFFSVLYVQLRCDLIKKTSAFRLPLNETFAGITFQGMRMCARCAGAVGRLKKFAPAAAEEPRAGAFPTKGNLLRAVGEK